MSEGIIQVKLTGKQKLFADFYVGAARFNGTKAAILAGYSEKTAKSIASENLTKPNIRAYIDEALRERLLGKNEVLARLADIATGSIEDLLGETGEFDYKAAKAAGKLGLVKKVKGKITERKIGESDIVEIDRTYELEMYSAHEALRDLGKYHKLFTDRIEHADEKGGPLIPRDLSVSINMIYGGDDEGQTDGREQSGSDGT